MAASGLRGDQRGDAPGGFGGAVPDFAAHDVARAAFEQKCNDRIGASLCADDFEMQSPLGSADGVDGIEQECERPGRSFAHEKREARRVADQAGGRFQDGAAFDFAQTIILERCAGAR